MKKVLKSIFTFILEYFVELTFMVICFVNCFSMYHDKTISPKEYSILIGMFSSQFVMFLVGMRIRSSEKNLQKQINELKESKNA